jgi:hypothetical protein
MSLILPSSYDLERRWPLALLAVSGLIIFGDQKHSDDGRATNERGAPIDMVRYDLAYSWEKMSRHQARHHTGDQADHETGWPPRS